MALANSNGRSHGNWFLNGFSPEQQETIIQDDIDHEPNIYQIRGITRMPASALGCLCVMQVWGQYINPMAKERKARKRGCFPFQRWLYAFQKSPYLSLTNMQERDALDFWREFSTSSQWEEVWKPWTESLNNDDITARCYYMKWLRVVDKSRKVKWDDAFKDVFRFRNGPFGFEIVEILNRPDWLDADSTTDADGTTDADSTTDASSCG